MKTIALLLATILAFCGLISAQDICRKACTRIYMPICTESQLLGRSSRCTVSNQCEFMNLQRCNPFERWTQYGSGACAGPFQGCRISS